MILWNSLILIFVFKLGTGVPFFKEQIPSLSRKDCRITVNFTNKNGAAIPCISKGDHMTNMRWFTSDGLVTDVPGLRYVDSHGTLEIRPFNRTNFNQKIHQNNYQCTGTTIEGTIIVKDVCVNGEIEENGSPEPPPVLTTEMTLPKLVVPPRFMWSHRVLIMSEGQNLSFACRETGNPHVIFSWQKNKSTVEVNSNPGYFFSNYSTENEMTSKLHITHTSRNDEGEYTCLVTGKEGIKKASLYLEVIASDDSRVRVESGGELSVKVTWKVPLQEQQHGFLKGYIVGFRKAGSRKPYTYKHVEHSPDKELQSTYITGIQTSPSYEILVKIYDPEIDDPISNKVIETTTETGN